MPNEADNVRRFHGEFTSLIALVKANGAAFFLTTDRKVTPSIHAAARRAKIKVRTRRIHRAEGYGYDVQLVQDAQES
jgi:hypothetical protein